MAENSRAVVLNVLVEPDAIAGLGQKIGERSLADFERVAAEIVAVQLDQIDWTATISAATRSKSARLRSPIFWPRPAMASGSTSTLRTTARLFSAMPASSG